MQEMYTKEMICNLLIIKHGLKNEQQINKQLFSITVL